MTATVKHIQLMLKESNAIEGVYDKRSLADAHAAWKYMMMYDTINTQIIKHAHKILMKHQDVENKYKGNWRDVPVFIGGIKKSDPPLVIDKKMSTLCKKILAKGSDPIDLHVEFEEIHPFIDGNGRIGRMVMNWHSVKRNGGDLIVYTEADKQTYYELFTTGRSKSSRVTMFSDLMEQMKKDNFTNL